MSHQPRLIFFGEHHQTEAFRTKFTDFFFGCATRLCPEPYKFVFVELRHESTTDLQNYFNDQFSLADYRTKWIRAESMMSMVPDAFFDQLKSLHRERSVTVIAMNKEDPGRDLFMRSTILDALADSGIGLAWVGAGHALRRPAKSRTDWLSCLELLEDANLPCLSMVECSRRDLLDDRTFDYRLETLLNTNQHVGVAFTTELGSYSDIVSETVTIGVENIFPEFARATIHFRFCHYDGVFIDPERFLSTDDEKLRRGAPADFSNSK